MVNANQAKQAGKGYKNEAARKAGEIADLEANRQKIPNPYANMRDLSGIAKDLSSMISNPYANLGVATQAAKMQAEEENMSLANTLDTLRATGASAGGATALAQAALQSKKGVSASIEQQESTNEKLKAQGAAEQQAAKVAEAQRIQQAKYGEGIRMQQAQAEGIKFQYGEQESRDISKLNRLSGQEMQAKQSAAQAKSAENAAIASGFSSVGSIVGGYSSGGGSAVGSDRRLKDNIKLIGISPKGLNIYSFEYKDKKFGEGTWQGVMSDEIPSDFILRHEDGFDRVDYSFIDVEFKQI
jgi:hypothetical protein